jgi:stage III sporulation protein AE
MRSTVFSLLIALCMIFAIPAHAETERPYLQGEDSFNQTVDEVVDGQFSLNPIKLINLLKDDLVREIKESASDIAVFLSLAAMSGVIGVLNSAFENKSSGETAFFACFTLMSAAAVNCFTVALGYGMDVISAMSGFITKLSPLLSITLLSCGAVTSAASFHPVLSAAVYVITIVVEKCLMPLICFGAILSIAGNVSDKVQLSGFCRVVKSAARWIMAAVVTIFTGISAIYGFSAPALDAVSAKTVKFAVGSLVPVVGSFLSDTLETVVSGTRLMKNAVGVSGIVVVCAICAIPVLKIGAMQLMMRIAAAVVEPITDKRISAMLWEISETVTTIFGMVIMTAVLFIINISIILAVTS